MIGHLCNVPPFFHPCPLLIDFLYLLMDFSIVLPLFKYYLFLIHIFNDNYIFNDELEECIDLLLAASSYALRG